MKKKRWKHKQQTTESSSLRSIDKAKWGAQRHPLAPSASPRTWKWVTESEEGVQMWRGYNVSRVKVMHHDAILRVTLQPSHYLHSCATNVRRKRSNVWTSSNLPLVEMQMYPGFLPCLQRKSQHRSLSSSSRTFKRKDNNSKLSRKDFSKRAVRTLLDRTRTAKLKVEPRSWMATKQEVGEDRQRMFHEALSIVQDLEKYIQAETLLPRTRDKQSVSVLLERILELYVESDAMENKSIFDETMRLLDRSRQSDWECDLSHRHIDLAVTIAVYERRWREAANLYRAHIDNALLPCEVSVSRPIGLYAIAMSAKEEGALVAERVFDTVLAMSMVSPQDQNKYVLAGGNAVGYAGECEQLIEYLKTSYYSESFGDSLVAATMQACILCNQDDEALNVFMAALQNDSIASEWLTAGRGDVVPPLCRDLAMRAMGGSKQNGQSDTAVQLLEETQADVDVALSVEAVHGVVASLVNDGRTESAIDLFFSLLYSSEMKERLVDGDLLDLSLDSGMPGGRAERLFENLLAALLPPLMRSCNHEQQFGVSLLLLDIVSLKTAESVAALDATSTLLPSFTQELIRSTRNADDFLSCVLVALAGLECYKEAFAAFDKVAVEGKFPLSDKIESWVQLEAAKFGKDYNSHTWSMIRIRLHQIISAVFAVRADPSLLRSSDSQVFSFAVASVIRSAVWSGQPEMGLYLARWVESSLSQEDDVGHSSLFFTGTTVFPMSDCYVSSGIAAANSSGKVELVQDLIESHVIRQKDWIQSSTEVLKFISEESVEDFTPYFNDVIAERRNPAVFAAAAVGLAEKREWPAVVKMYRLALTSGCISEEISLFAMKAAVAEKRNNVLVLLRAVADEISKVVGVSQVVWLGLQYSHLKLLLGKSTTFRLMWWDDKETAYLDELEYAMETLSAKIAKGLSPNRRFLRIIASAAAKSEAGYIPAERTSLPSVPRTSEAWVEVLESVSRMAESTAVSHEPIFVRDICLALERLGCEEECVKFTMNSVVSKGVQIPEAAGGIVLRASRRLDSNSSIAHDAEMMWSQRAPKLKGQSDILL